MKKIKVGDKVVVIAGKSLGKEGKVLSINWKISKVVLEGLNEYKKTIKPSKENPEGGFLIKSMAIHVSNVSQICPKTNGATRVKIELDPSGKRIRKSKKCGANI